MPQRRWTVLLRIILAVPHMFVLEVLTFVAGVVAFIGWWGALFTGRLPEFAVTFQSGYLRWYTRFNGYLCLLTDVWPPFSFDDDPAYPVRVAIRQAQRLNRAAVFFRCVLSIPAWFLVLLVTQAMTPIGFVAWLITSSGRCFSRDRRRSTPSPSRMACTASAASTPSGEGWTAVSSARRTRH